MMLCISLVSALSFGVKSFCFFLLSFFSFSLPLAVVSFLSRKLLIFCVHLTACTARPSPSVYYGISTHTTLPR